MKRAIVCSVICVGLFSLPPLVFGQQYKSYGSMGRFYVPKSYSPPRSYTPRAYKHESRNWSVGGYSKHQYKYKSGGRTYKGTIETFPSGRTRHKGKWK